MERSEIRVPIMDYPLPHEFNKSYCDDCNKIIISSITQDNDI